jgi:hypothetical protein
LRAEAAMEKGIDVARRQNAKSWELRGAMSLARPRRQQCRQREAVALLACLRRAYRRVRYRTVAPCRERETIGWGETNGLIAVVGCAWDALPAAIRGAA